MIKIMGRGVTGLGTLKRIPTDMNQLREENEDQDGIVIIMGLLSQGMKDRLLLIIPIGDNIDLDRLLSQIGENVMRGHTPEEMITGIMTMIH
nr:hypothetical protein Iba_chr13aCG4910 [Ipomoea batatas]